MARSRCSRSARLAASLAAAAATTRSPAFLAHHHAGDVGPPPAWGGIADDGPDAPCAVAGMFGCAPMNSTYDYWKNGVPWEGPPVVFH